jgi:hypothetical protein
MFFSGALVKAVNEDCVGETAALPNASHTKLLEGADYEGIHLDSEGFREDEAVFFDGFPDIVLKDRVVLS